MTFAQVAISVVKGIAMIAIAWQVRSKPLGGSSSILLLGMCLTDLAFSVFKLAWIEAGEKGKKLHDTRPNLCRSCIVVRNENSRYYLPRLVGSHHFIASDNLLYLDLEIACIFPRIWTNRVSPHLSDICGEKSR